MTLDDFFRIHQKTALAFSGGVDSAYLLYRAVQSEAEVKAYYVKSAFQPEFELQDAKKLAAKLHADLQIIPVNILSDHHISENPANRCYFCKQHIFRAIIDAAQKDGFPVVLDGTNASDQWDDRPGMKALQELEILSPLRMCGLTKTEIRKKSREAGLFTWNKPAYACLATRIPAGESITAEKLSRTEKSESYLASLGFRNFRVRSRENQARLQIRQEDMQLLVQNQNAILNQLKQYYSEVLLDLEVR